MSLQQVTDLEYRSRGLADFSRSSAAPLEAMVSREAGTRKIADVVGEMDSAQAQAGSTADVAQSIYERQVKALGGNQDADSQRAANRRLGLSRALVSVDSRNRSLQGMRARTDIARSASADLQSVVEGQAFRTQSQAAEMATDREVQYQGELAKYKQDKAAGLGQLASMASMFIPGVGPLVAPMIGQAVTKAAM